MTQVRLIIMASLIFVTMIANANPTVITADCADNDGLTCAVGIDNLDIMDMRFDVVYVIGRYDSIFEMSDPFFLGDDAGAFAARDAIIAAQDRTGIDGAIGQGDSFLDVGLSVIYIPTLADEISNDGICTHIRPAFSDIWEGCTYGGFPNNQSGQNGPGCYDSYAVFSKLSAVTQLQRLDTAVTGQGSGDSLAVKIELAQAYLAVPDVESACGVLNAFLKQISAQRGKKLSVELADQLTGDAQALMSEVGCN